MFVGDDRGVRRGVRLDLGVLRNSIGLLGALAGDRVEVGIAPQRLAGRVHHRELQLRLAERAALGGLRGHRPARDRRQDHEREDELHLLNMTFRAGFRNEWRNQRPPSAVFN